MINSSQHLQVLYQAYGNTHLLWKNANINSLKQLHLPLDNNDIFNRKLEKQLRLGQLAEQFVFNQIETCTRAVILAENIQVQKEKRTLGELDTLLLLDRIPIHLEIVYKFYQYDASLGSSEIECWIGPNRTDSLIEKLNKLEQKQLPLLFSKDCKHALKQLNLDHHDFQQHVLFKAQLFIPYEQQIHFEFLNADCVSGFHINTSQLEGFKTHQFYIPTKLDWFLEPNENVDWMDWIQFKLTSQPAIERHKSPLFWLKSNTGKLSKAFLVWW